MLRGACRPNRLLSLAIVLALITIGCRRSATEAHDTPPASGQRRPQAAANLEPTRVGRDLSDDERMGGHTLARHVGKTDGELVSRLRREPDISSASTYTDRRTAERTVADALAFSQDRIDVWRSRSGRRPNLALRYVNPSRQPVGRSFSRGAQASVPCERVVVVLRWNERADRFYVLTSYPETDR